MRLTAAVQESLLAVGLDPAYIESVVQRSIDEDLDGGVDVTSQATVPADQQSTMDLVTRARGVVAGIPVAAAAFDVVSRGSANIEIVTADGTRVDRGDVLLTISGSTRDLLLGERTALNLLCHLSGVATATREWADVLEGSRAKVRDTRKTTPGLRILATHRVLRNVPNFDEENLVKRAFDQFEVRSFRTAAELREALDVRDPKTVRFTFKVKTNKELPLILGQLPILSKAYWSKRDFTAIGQVAVSRTLVSRSSAIPCVARASRSAVAGAMTMRSASRESSICPISASSVSEKRSS